MLESKVKNPVKLSNYLKLKKGPDFIFRNESSVTDSKFYFHMFNYKNITIENLHMRATGSLINIKLEVKNSNVKQTLTDSKAIH